MCLVLVLTKFQHPKTWAFCLRGFLMYCTKVWISLFEKQKFTSWNIILASFLRVAAPCGFFCLIVCVSLLLQTKFPCLRLKLSVWGALTGTAQLQSAKINLVKIRNWPVLILKLHPSCMLQRPVVFSIYLYVSCVGTDEISVSLDLNFLSDGLFKVPTSQNCSISRPVLHLLNHGSTQFFLPNFPEAYKIISPSRCAIYRYGIMGSVLNCPRMVCPYSSA